MEEVVVMEVAVMEVEAEGEGRAVACAGLAEGGQETTKWSWWQRLGR